MCSHVLQGQATLFCVSCKPNFLLISDELKYILNQYLDDEFMGVIWDDTSDDDGSDSASGDDLQLDSVQEPDNSLSDTEIDGNDNNTPIGWMTHYPISREWFPFTGDRAVKVVLENPQDPMEIFLSLVVEDMIEHLVRETKQIYCQSLWAKDKKRKINEEE